MKFIDYQVY